ncbi:MAG: hypothetical protein OQK51_25130 [Kangiellaceae bacterium]|nr:hypothetical protein [Kangiellaceae bacterium]
MKISSYTLQIDKEANESLIDEVISKLPERDDPFAILSKDDMNYMQCLWTEQGFILRYQEGSIDRHYCSSDFLDGINVVRAFKQYLCGENAWKDSCEFYLMNHRGFWGSLGYKTGLFFGSILRGFKEARK